MKTHSQNGFGMVAVVMAMAVCATLVLMIFAVTGNQVIATRRVASRAAAQAYGDAVIESFYDQWRTLMSTSNDSTKRAKGLTTADLAAAIVLPSSSGAGAALPIPPGVSLGAWSVIACTPFLEPTTDVAGFPVAENGTSSPLRARLQYLASITVNYSTPSGAASVTMKRTFVRTGKNIFDDFFFGTLPVTEFHPGADMYVGGKMYIEGDFYTAHDTLHLLDNVTVNGTHTLNYSPLDSRLGTAPTIGSGGVGDNWDVNNPPKSGQTKKLLDTPVASLESVFLDGLLSNDTSADGNPNNDGYHEMVEEKVGNATVADPLQIDPTTTERLVGNSDYRILVDASNNVTVYKGSLQTPLSVADPQYVAISGALVLDRAFKEAREQGNIRLVSLDVGKIKDAKAAGAIVDSVSANGDLSSGAAPDGLMLYIQDTSYGTSVPTNIVNSATGATTAVTSSKSRGVRLMNGSKLPAGGFSVVSPNPVYIQGDYNTGSNGATLPPSNTATNYTPPVDTPSPVVTGYTRESSAVVGDAVNILSNAWNDAIPQGTASNTTINTALMSGGVPTTASSYSGGIENFTRLHESWVNKYLTIYGSLSLLYNSNQATGPWGNAQYAAPKRRWYYDSGLQASNPPGFKAARTYERGSWLQR